MYEENNERLAQENNGVPSERTELTGAYDRAPEAPDFDHSGYNANAGSTYDRPLMQDGALSAPAPERILQAETRSDASSPVAEKRKRHIGRKLLLALACIICAGAGCYAGSMLARDQITEDVTAAVQENLTELMAEAGGAVLYRSVDTAADSSASGGDSIVSEVAALAADSVVEIATEVMVQNMNPFSWFYGGGGSTLQQGAGSGVILSEDGYILTCYHVIDGATSIAVALRNGDTYEATLVGGDASLDVAVIKVEAEGLTPAVLGDSGNLVVGSPVVAIGNPLGQLGGTVTGGYVSALDRAVTIDGETFNVLQTDAAINGGNSGGGLFNAKGELIGLVNAKAESIGVEGLGFAIPIDDIKQDIEDIINYGSVVRVQLGVSLLNATSERTILTYGLSGPGVYIMAVEPNSNAALAGLTPGDRIVSVDGEEITDADRVIEIIGTKKPGDTMQMVVERNGEEITFDIILYAEIPEESPVQPTRG